MMVVIEGMKKRLPTYDATFLVFNGIAKLKVQGANSFKLVAQKYYPLALNNFIHILSKVRSNYLYD
jgi:hypothetical protein